MFSRYGKVAADPKETTWSEDWAANRFRRVRTSFSRCDVFGNFNAPLFFPERMKLSCGGNAEHVPWSWLAWFVISVRGAKFPQWGGFAFNFPILDHTLRQFVQIRSVVVSFESTFTGILAQLSIRFSFRGGDLVDFNQEVVSLQGNCIASSRCGAVCSGGGGCY